MGTEATRKHEANRAAKLKAKRTAKQKKEADQRKDLADLAENRIKRGDNLDKEASNTDALEKRASQRRQRIPQTNPRRLRPKKKTAQLLPAISKKKVQTPRGKNSSTPSTAHTPPFRPEEARKDACASHKEEPPTQQKKPCLNQKRPPPSLAGPT